jgi:1-acyl-sn-glycerol-3-phosphate acyltransferase
MIVANHTSMADIMLMLDCQKPLCFVWKTELAKIPLFGFLQANVFLVDRSCSKSRLEVFKQAQNE